MNEHTHQSVEWQQISYKVDRFPKTQNIFKSSRKKTKIPNICITNKKNEPII